MSKKKRIFNTEASAPPVLQLRSTQAEPDEQVEKIQPRVPERQFFPPELIARLTERIKKL